MTLGGDRWCGRAPHRFKNNNNKNHIRDDSISTTCLPPRKSLSRVSNLIYSMEMCEHMQKRVMSNGR